MASIFGNNIKISIFGESHGTAIGVVIDGLPSGIKIDMNEVDRWLDMRMGFTDINCEKICGTTRRDEQENVVYISGIHAKDERSASEKRIGITTGTPLTAIIYNKNQDSEEYENLKNKPRPGHSDFTQWKKWGDAADLLGGGHLSGRLTAPLVIAGTICKGILEKSGIKVESELVELGGHKLICSNGEVPKWGSKEFIEAMNPIIFYTNKNGDSIGGIIKTVVKGMPAGIGEPIFQKVESLIGQMMFSIPGVKGVEFGCGFKAASMTGSRNNDCFVMEGGQVVTKTNNCGGILGGITTGGEVVFQVAVKPTPSIRGVQETVNLKSGSKEVICIEGRHDTAIAIRCVPVVSCATAIVIYDLMRYQREI